jgi:putative proteasome-type protease
MIYPEGNFIATSDDTPFLQIGEVKYGKPILDRLVDVDSSLEQAASCALLSMDATTRSNLSVGPPIELNVYAAGSLVPGRHTRFGEESRFLRELRHAWNRALHASLLQMPAIDWNENGD